MIKVIVIFLLICFVSLCCSNRKSNELIRINPNNFIKKDCSLSDFASDIEYIPLDNKMIIKGISNIEIDENRIFLAGGGLVLFNMGGAFVRRIGRRGSGPGEYKYGMVFTTDEQNGKIYILDSKNILQYSFDGVFEKSISLEKFGASFYSILFQNNKLYLFEYLYYGQSKYNWLVLDTTGQEISSKLNSVKPFRSEWPGPDESSYIFDNEIRYWNMYNDTLFSIRDTTYTPYLLFDKGDFRYPPRGLVSLNAMSNYWYPDQIVETHQYLFINSLWKNYRQFFYIDKNSKQLYLVNKKKAAGDHFMQYGIENNLDGGPWLEPLYYFQTDSDEYLVSWFGAFELKAHVASEAFKNSTPKYPEKKRELEQLANSLNDNDNPVLMLVKLKE